jgi:hypothetical protein
MATTRQEQAARRNSAKANEVQSKPAATVTRQREGMSTAEKNRLADTEFAFPKQRKEPLSDARHVRNAIARFDQVKDVSDRERDEAWKRIKRAARRHDVEVSAGDWRELGSAAKANPRRSH